MGVCEQMDTFWVLVESCEEDPGHWEVPWEDSVYC